MLHEKNWNSFEWTTFKVFNSKIFGINRLQVSLCTRQQSRVSIPDLFENACNLPCCFYWWPGGCCLFLAGFVFSKSLYPNQQFAAWLVCATKATICNGDGGKKPEHREAPIRKRNVQTSRCGRGKRSSNERLANDPLFWLSLI